MGIINREQFAFIDPISAKYGDYGLPDYMWHGLQRYLLDGIQPGGFMTAMLGNDLELTVARADEENLEKLGAWVMFLHNEIPAAAWGNPERVELWVKRCGWIGIYGNED